MRQSRRMQRCLFIPAAQTQPRISNKVGAMPGPRMLGSIYRGNIACPQCPNYRYFRKGKFTRHGLKRLRAKEKKQWQKECLRS